MVDTPTISYTSSATMTAHGSRQLHRDLSEKLYAAKREPFPKVEVRFQNISLKADVKVASDMNNASKHAKQHEMPSMINELKKQVSGIFTKRYTVQKTILNNVSGVFKPGTLTLVLGQSESGKSALMKLLAGQFPMDKSLSLDGDISYNDRSRDQLLRRLPRFATYVGQIDNHFPMLTVAETLSFAHECCIGSPAQSDFQHFFHDGAEKENADAVEAFESVVRHAPEVAAHAFGLQNCYNTAIGDSQTRGVSGGERKRVTSAEMELGLRYVSFLDEISTGLDSAATYDIVNAHRSMADRFNKTVVMSLLQPPPEVFELFDNVLLLQDGEMLYNGPREDVLSYFKSIGLTCPEDRDTADFLCDLASDKQVLYETTPNDGCVASAPRDATEYAKCFQNSSMFTNLQQELSTPIQPELAQVSTQYLDPLTEFQRSFFAELWAVTKRQMLILLRNTSFLKIRGFMVIIMSLIYGSLFYDIDMSNPQLVSGVVFCTAVFLGLAQAALMPLMYDSREVFYKHRAANFYRTSSYVLAMTFSFVPLAFSECATFSTIIYWICGLVPTAAQFFFFVFCMVLNNIVFLTFFLFLTSLIPSIYQAQPVMMLTLEVFIIYSGFIQPFSSIHDWLVWIYWLNPLAWCIRSVLVSQYRHQEYDECIYGSTDYCEEHNNMTMGEYSLSLYSVPSEKFWEWLGLVYLLSYAALFSTTAYFLLENFRHVKPSSISVTRGKKSEEDKNETSIVQDNVYTSIETPRNHDKAKTDMEIHVDHPHEKLFTPVTIAFRNLRYSVPVSKTKDQPQGSIELLKGITGYAMPGSMTALMGSSGAGKTTLMDVIAGRKTAGKMQGDILINGHPASSLAMRRSTGYCEQDDIHSQATTFREALTFSAFLRQGQDVPDSKKYETVQECLELLGLESIADKIVRGSPPEQLKRLTIGVELAAQPSVLFLDEPTSGLDARKAKLVMEGVRSVADSGRTVLCTIHQPSSEVFFMFDKLLLLKHGGETVYFGDVGHEGTAIVDYFSKYPSAHGMPEDYNPSTWMLEVIGAGVGQGEQRHKNYDEIDFVQSFNESKAKEELDAQLDRPGVFAPLDGSEELLYRQKRASSNWTQIKLLLQKFFRMYWRTPEYTLTRMQLILAIAIIEGLMLLGNGYDDYQSINAGVGVLFCSSMFSGVQSFSSILPLVYDERGVYYRERAAETYNAIWYFLAFVVVEIPYVLVATFTCTAFFFPMAGFTGVGTWLQYWIAISLQILLHAYLGQFLMFALPSMEVASILGMVFNESFQYFTGYNPPAKQIPQGYKWLYEFTPQRFAWSMQVALALGDCPDDQMEEIEATNRTIDVSDWNIGCQYVDEAPDSIGIYKPTNMEYLREVFGVDLDEMGRYWGLYLAVLVVLWLLTALAMRFLNYMKK